MRKMKDSGIEWIGEIPEDWSITKYGRCVRRIKEYDDNPNKTVLSLTIKGVKVKDLSDNMGKLASDYTGHQIVRKGNLVVTPRDFDCTPILSGIAPCDGCISNLYFILESNGKIYLPYINHQMWGVKYGGDIWKRLSYGMRYSYNYEQFSNIALAIPQFYEQQIIADYLDNKVKDIDNIILKTKETIEEYKKYKQSVITEAVTKGLNPNVEMKDSGIEWIGKIPKDFNIISIKRIIEVKDGTHDTPTYVEKSYNTYPLITSKNIINNMIDFENVNYISEEDYIKINKRSNVEKYDIIMPMIGTVGNPAIVYVNNNFSIKNVALFKSQGNIILAKFIKYVLMSDIVINQFKLLNKGGVQSFISLNNLQNIKIPLIDDYNKSLIVSYLDKKCNEIDKLISKKEQLITELEQYKKSLIYECVTGKKEVSPAYAD